MDSLVSSALEEICCRGSAGLTLVSLWATLTPTPAVSLKASLWANLLSIPTLQFIMSGSDTPLSPIDPKIQCFEDAEKLSLKIVANEHLRDCFVGLYDIPSSSIGPLQRSTLERLAVARTNGITQKQLAKEFGIEGNNFFYRVRNLECRKLIVRQPVVVKTKEADGDGETKNSSIVNTNLIYLSRYAKHLGVQQRFEINKEEQNPGSPGNVEEIDVSVDGFERESLRDDLLVKDFFPAMKAICEKLEAAHDKVLVVSDIKKSLGYTKSSGHRAWRYICRRLKDACIVEEFDAKVNEKVERCLRLLKKFPPKNFEFKTLGCGHDCDEEQLVKFGRRYQRTDQLVELPIDHQIYDAIDAKKSEGATVIEVCGRLSLDRKKNDSRFHSLFSRFGMHVQAENHKKTVAFRVWTSENSNPDELNAFLDKSQIDIGRNNISTFNLDNHDVPGRSSELPEYNHSISEVDFATSGNMSDRGIDSELCWGSPEDGQTNHVLHSPAKVPEVFQQSIDIASNAKLDLVSVGTETSAASSKTTLLNLPESGSHQKLPYLPLTADGASREQRILERLQNEKYILRVELHRWLVSLEKDKHTAMDRRTIERILNKLQQQGQCKVVEIKLPVVTKCTRNRRAVVVLHPSVQNFPPELMDKINDRLRTFEKQIRVEASSKLKVNESVPVLNGVMRTEIRVGSKEQVTVEAMRANGFVLAKMVRARLLHTFLWGHLSSFPGWDDVLSTGSCEHSYKFLALESAMKFIPIELFLKVVGTSKKNYNIIEKSQRGLCLADLPVEEYKQLMDTQATGRLSLIIDILRRLKLIRLIRKGHSEDGVKSPHASFMHAMELRPYIEEPSSVTATSNLGPLDLRPRIRHDFILSNREAVDEYWETLEYCFAAADPTAALHAFPGSAVPKVFHPRVWTSVWVMSADQRAKLQKRIMKDDFNKKISFEECVKVARDLNLSLQQVLRAYYRKHKQRFNIFEGVVNANDDHQSPEKIIRSTKRKRSSELSLVKRGRLDAVNEQLGEQGHMRLPETVDQFMENQEFFPSGHHGDSLPSDHEADCLESVEELGLGQEIRNSAISRCTFSKPLLMHQRRFSWTDANDRQLLIQYTREMAVVGPKGRIDWSRIPGLPAPPKTCARRIQVLKKYINFKKTLLKFCNLLHERYTKHLEKTQCASLNKNGCRVYVRRSKSKNVDNISNGTEDAGKTGFEEKQWDDFSDTSVKKAFENVLLFKQMAKLQASQGAGTASEELSNLNTNINSLESEFVSSSTLHENIHKHDPGIHKDSEQRSRRYRFHQKFIKCLNEGTFVNTQVHKSLAVSNAAELLKLVFLSTSVASDLQNHLAETLRRYSEHDLFGAFSYLREKKILIGGDGDQPFGLSQQFLQNISKSLFPSNTGKRAAKFSDWIHEREMEGGINLTEELHCGDIFQLFALVSSGELSISPCVPDEGVGEVEDSRSSKRKADDDDELFDCDRSKKMKSLVDGELISRREKGFPGIIVLMSCASILPVNAVELLNNGGLCIGEVDQNVKFNDVLGQKIISTSCPCDSIPEILNFDSISPTMRWPSDSPWEAMLGYAKYLMLKPSDSKYTSLCTPEIFRTICMAIQKAGDQGLSVEEVSQVVGENMHEHALDALQAFGYVLKVNAYDSVRFVDALYHSKYFLTTSMGSHQDFDPHSVTKPLERSKDGHSVLQSESCDIFGYNSQRKATVRDNHVHRVTILNLPEEVVAETKKQSSNVREGYLQEKMIFPEQDHDRNTHEFSSNYLHLPIFPWINGNGSINRVVYNGLVRRILGIVMQNPGILEENIIHQMDVLNPQSCRSLLELMILDKHLIVRKMHQSISSGPPALLGTLIGSSFKESKSIYRKHLFANPMSASFL